MTDDECIEKITVTVFPAMPGIGIIEEEPLVEEDNDACGDTTTTIADVVEEKSDTRTFTLATKDPMVKINKLLDAARERFGDSICIRVASYDSKEQIDDAVHWLNAALRGSGNNTVLDGPGFSTFVGSSAPILTINNRLSFVGLIPNENQFLTRIAATLRIVEGTSEK